MNFRADLHTHSTCSDGSLAPMEIIDLAIEIGLSGLSISDHDTTSAYSADVLAYAKKCGIRLLTGVEFSCIHNGFTVHILGYGFNPTDAAILEFCEKHEVRRRKRNLAMLEKLSRLGMHIKGEELYESTTGVVGRPHIAKLLMEKGHVDSITEAFNKFLGDGKCCFVKGESFTIDESMDIIHHAGGKVFIAHPHLITPKGLLKEILKMPFDGIECYYSLMPRSREERWLALAKEKNLLISGGSDFHGSIKPGVPLGCSWVNEETFEKISCSTTPL